MAYGISQLENRDWNFKNDVRVTGSLKSGGTKYLLEEYFSHKPGLTADIIPASADDGNDGATKAEFATMNIANKHFEILGTNASSDDVTFATTDAGILFTLDGADNDQVILLPHLDTNQTAWTGVKWGTENQVEWECAIKTGSVVTTTLIWAGLKLTNTPTIATDDDQVMFRFSTDDSDTYWMCIDSIGGSDTSTSSGITVAASTWYRLRIKILSSRAAQFYINDVLVHTTSELTNDVDLIPYIGVQALDTMAPTLGVAYEKISRILYE